MFLYIQPNCHIYGCVTLIDWKNFLTRFLESSKDTIITSTDKEHTILKKYEMQRFTSQSEADKVIADFAKLVKDNTGVKFFKENFYRSDIL